MGDGLGTAPGRRELAEALRQANDQYGHPEARELAARLADPSTRVVITGQQPGLFGGPLYTLSKAVAAQLWAERLEAAGEPAIALFWMATEDHDFRESSRATFFTTEGVKTFDLGEDNNHWCRWARVSWVPRSRECWPSCDRRSPATDTATG